MTEKGFIGFWGADRLNYGTSGSHSLALLPVLDLRPMDPVLYQRSLTAVWRSRKERDQSNGFAARPPGLAFQEETLDF